MKFTTCYLLIFFLLTLSVITRSGAQEGHTHGVAVLTLAIEKGMVEIQFESPAANLVGFEHKAKSLEERKAVTETETTLKEPELLFSFVGAHCQPKKTTIDVSGVMDDEHKEKKEHSEHEHHSHSLGHGEIGHSEITASYRFSCKDPKNLIAVTIGLFKQFPGIEKINAMWVTESRQGSELLSPNRNTLSLR